MNLLYHYTTQQGLLGIFNSKAVWSTNTHFLNDPTEFVHALSFAKSIANYFFDNDYFEQFGAMLHRHVGKLKGEGLYVSSFSERPDLLSQWRGYCPGGSGYCLGFDRKILQQYCEARGYRLEKCVYGHDDQQAEVTGIVTTAMALFPKMEVTPQQFHELPTKEKLDSMVAFHEHLKGEGADQASEAISLICESLLEVAPRFKNAGFEEEAEWRIIVNEPDAKAVSFRAGPSYLIPHIALDIIEANPDVVRSLIVGPNPNQARAVKAAEALFQSLDYSPDLVTASSIPFNYW